MGLDAVALECRMAREQGGRQAWHDKNLREMHVLDCALHGNLPLSLDATDAVHADDCLTHMRDGHDLAVGDADGAIRAHLSHLGKVLDVAHHVRSAATVDEQLPQTLVRGRSRSTNLLASHDPAPLEKTWGRGKIVTHIEREIDLVAQLLVRGEKGGVGGENSAACDA